jgi:hypothetical protein
VLGLLVDREAVLFNDISLLFVSSEKGTKATGKLQI